MDILKTQQALNKQGFGPLAEDGVNGPKTTGAVKAFQKAKGLEVDGKVGPKTLAALFPNQTAQPVDNKFNLKPWIGAAKSVPERAKEIAYSQVGVREATGKNDGPAVEAFLRAVGLGKGFAWCMAFVYWAYEQAAKELGTTNPLVKTGGVLDMWNKVDGKTGILRTKIPRTGDIFIMDFGGGAGHTGIVLGFSGDGKSINTLEGNTNSNGSRNGDGVYLRIREISTIKGFIHVH